MSQASSGIDSFNPRTTSVNYPWPKEVTGIERIALSSHGDLQRVLSAFFARPIVVALVYSQSSRQSTPLSKPDLIAQPTPFLIASVSPTSPITQTRQVHLQCAGKIVCTATSTVRITSPHIAHLFLLEKYAIGQMFRQLEKIPSFEIVAVGLGDVVESERTKDDNNKRSSSTTTTATKKKNQLWRKYILSIPDFECEILEVFPDRQMFIGGDSWLSDCVSIPELVQRASNPNAPVYQGLKPVALVAFLLIVLFEAWKWKGIC